MGRNELLRLYHAELPAFLTPFLETPELRRLREVGMNCGCEYTAFPRFRNLPAYSRFSHSLGAALIVWHFTGDRAQTLAALFHDIATPAFQLCAAQGRRQKSTLLKIILAIFVSFA